MGKRYIRRLLNLGAMATIKARRRKPAGDDWLWGMMQRKPMKVSQPETLPEGRRWPPSGATGRALRYAGGSARGLVHHVRGHNRSRSKSVRLRRKRGATMPRRYRQNHRPDSNQVAQWRTQLMEGGTFVFGDAAKAEETPAVHVQALHAKADELSLDRRARAHDRRRNGTPASRCLSERSHEVTVRRQGTRLEALSRAPRGSIHTLRAAHGMDRECGLVYWSIVAEPARNRTGRMPSLRFSRRHSCSTIVQP